LLSTSLREVNAGRVSMERRLAQSAARAQRTPDGIGWWRGLTSAADGAFAITGEGRITLWNTVAERITGHTAAEVVGRHCYAVTESRAGSGASRPKATGWGG
jgi:PAS domain-containing protein